MKNITLILLATAFLISCSSKKQTEEALATGHYDEAIAIALKNLRTNKNKKGKQPYIIMLESAYRKVQRRDLERITYLKSDGNPANLERIYNLYLALKNRQERIKPLLPLYIIEKVPQHHLHSLIMILISLLRRISYRLIYTPMLKIY
jgi:hypothetical protein